MSAQIIPMPTSSPFAQYLQHGWKLVPVAAGSKGPQSVGWNTEAACIDAAGDIPEGMSAGLAHAYSGTCAVDLDELFGASIFCAERGIDLQALMDAPDAVQVISGRYSSGKLLYRLDTPLPSKMIKLYNKCIIEFRCSTAEGLTVQDLVPPSKHPSGTTYQWGGKGSWQSLPPLPEALRQCWEELIESKRDPAPKRDTSPKGDASAAGAADPDITPDMVRDMLTHISADCARDDWRNYGMAIQHQFGDAGFELWNEWSATATGKASDGSAMYKGERATMEQYRSFRADKDGGITIATLVGAALKAGWNDPRVADKISRLFRGTPAPEKPRFDWEPDAHPDGDAAAPPFPDPFPGVMADVFDAVLPMANKPQPELTVLSLLIGMASCVSGRYYFGNGQRANLFGIGVCETGGGKDWVRLNGEQLAYYGGASRIDQPASGEGLEDSLIDFGGTIMSVDEVGFMFAATNAHNAQSHLVKLKREVLRLFSASRTVVHGRLKAGGITRTIHHPCLNILGFTTPSVLGRSMTGNDVSSGELPRYMMVFGRDGVPQRRTKGKFVMPDGVVRQAKMLTAALAFAKKDDEGLIEITASPEGEAALDAAMTTFSTAPAGGVFSNDLLTRAYEKVERIAMVLAVWSNPSAPVILPDMVEWAVDFVTYSNWSLATFADKHMVSEASIADANHITDIAGKIMAGRMATRNENERKIIKDGLVPWSMLLNKSKFGVKEFSAAMDYMVQTDVVELSSMPFTLKASGGTKHVKVIKFRNV